MELLQELAHFGLSEKEGLVYLASLELGPAPVQDISHKAKVNRATTYVMIESLMGRGLMSSFVRGKKRHYASESPERLRTLLRAQKRELEAKEVELEKVFPMLSALYNAEGAKPQVRYLEGVEGIQTVREMLRNLEGEIVQLVPYAEPLSGDELASGREMHMQQIVGSNVPYRALVVMEPDRLSSIPTMPNLELRVVPRNMFPNMHAEITVRANTIFLYSFKSAILAVVLTSQELADGFRTLFELAWKAAEAYPSRKT